MSQLVCSICLEEIKKDSTTKWECNHTFHSNCIKNWDISCPCCRNTNKINRVNKINKNNIMSIEGLKRNNIILGRNKEIYLNKWNDRECITNNHQILCVRNYGVLAVCEDCNTIQTFNLLHNI